MNNKVLVTGATGAIAGTAISRLRELGMVVRAMVRQEDERSDKLKSLGVEVVIGDLTAFNDISSALKGVGSVLFIFPVRDGLLRSTAFLAQAALEERLHLIVNISQRTAARDVPSHAAQDHWLAERLLDRCGVPVTHLQPTLFMEWLTYFPKEIKVNNRFVSSFGDARYGIINSEDIARVAAAVLADPSRYGSKSFPLYGPAELNGQDIADILSKELKRKIDFVAIEPEAIGPIILAAEPGVDNTTRIQHLIAIGHMFRSGKFAGMNCNVAELTGRQPLSVADYVRKHLDILQ